MDDILQGYSADAKELIPRFEALSSAEVLNPIRDLLPTRGSRILDVGAGTGRDAAWLARKAHDVTAAEPVAAFRRAGMALHRDLTLSWIDDRLPGLAEVRRTGQHYELILVVGVWQHLRPETHSAAITTLAASLARGGRLILSLRHGPGAPTRRCYPAAPEAIIRIADAQGLSLVARRESLSIQQKNREAGVTWTWLCFDAGG